VEEISPKNSQSNNKIKDLLKENGNFSMTTRMKNLKYQIN